MEDIAEDRAEQEQMWELFLSIWRVKPHFCEETGAYLGNEPLTTMFHHVLSKEKYPRLKSMHWNIMLLLPEVHEQAELNINKTPLVKERKEFLLSKL